MALEFQKALDAINASIPVTSLHKVRMAVYLNENNYMALKTLCEIRGLDNYRWH